MSEVLSDEPEPETGPVGTAFPGTESGTRNRAPSVNPKNLLRLFFGDNLKRLNLKIEKEP